MSTQLTISIELIALMQWVLKHKAEAFKDFLQNSIDQDLASELARVASDKSLTLPTKTLYETLSSFMDFMEDHIQQSLGRMPLKGEKRRTMPARATKQNGCRRHRRATRTTFDDDATIQSPVQKILYQALYEGEESSENQVN